MLIGQYNKRIEIQKLTAVQNEFGEQVRTWITVRSCWAKVTPQTLTRVRGRELFMARQWVANTELVFNIRYFSTSADMPDGITPDMRVVYKGKNYNIENVMNVDERNVEYEVYCSRVAT